MHMSKREFKKKIANSLGAEWKEKYTNISGVDKSINEC